MGRHATSKEIEEEHFTEHCECGCPWWMDDPWIKAAGCIVVAAFAALGVFAIVLRVMVALP